MKNKPGFTLVEVIIFLIISAILILATYPVLTKKKIDEGKNSFVIECIENIMKTRILSEPGCANILSTDCQNSMIADTNTFTTDLITAPSCVAAVKGSKANRTNYFSTLVSYVDGADKVLSDAGLIILRNICDQNGHNACDKFINRCLYEGKCNSGINCDMEYYLKLIPAEINLAKDYIMDIFSEYFKTNMTNAMNECDNLCCKSATPNPYNPTFTFACQVKGLQACPWKINLLSGINDRGNGIAIDLSGNSYIVGTSNNGTFDNIVIIKLDPNGNIIWQKRFAGVGNDSGNAIVLDSVGNIFVVGTTFNGTDNDIVVMKLSNDGTGGPGGNGILWQKRIDNTGNDSGNGIAKDISDNIYIVGTFNNVTKNNILAIKMANSGTGGTNSDGVLLQKGINSTYNTDDRGNNIAVDSSGIPYISATNFTGATGTPFANNIFVQDMIKLNTSFGITKSREFNIVSNVSDSGGVVVITGSNYPFYVWNSLETNGHGWGFALLQPSAALEWDGSLYFKDATANRNYEINAMTVDQVNGTIYLAGLHYNGTNNDIAITQLDNDLNPYWVMGINSSYNSDEQANGIAANDGVIYVAGTSNNGVKNNITVLKMNRNQTTTFYLTVPGTMAFNRRIVTDAGTSPTFTANSTAFSVSSPDFATSDPGFVFK